MAITLEKYKELRQKGWTPERIQLLDKGYSPEEVKQYDNRKNEGFFKSLGRNIITPVATMLARPIQLASTTLGGKSLEEVDVASRKSFGGYFGRDLDTPKNTADVVKDIGRGAETVALGIGGVGTVGAVKTGLLGLTKQAIKQEAIVGLKAGALTGFGMGLEEASQEPDSGKAFQKVFANTALGAGFGLVSGGVFGSVTPIVAKGFRGVRKFANVAELETKLANGYRKILNPTARQVKVDSRFGKNSFDFLAQELPDVKLNVDSNGKLDLQDALDMAKQKYAAEASAYKPIIKNSGKYTSVDDFVRDAKNVARKEFDGTDLDKALAQIDNEVESYLSKTPQEVRVTADGKRYVTLDRADDIKSYSWARGKGWLTPEAELWSDTNNLIGHAIKDAIERELPDAPVKAMNKRLGSWKNLIDMLEKRQGNVTGTGGKLSKYIIRSVGTSVGAGIGGKGEDSSVLGGLGGAGAGFITADILAALFSNPAVRLWMIRKILNNLKKAGKTDMIREAETILQQQATKYMLPAAGESSYVSPIQKAINLPQSARESTLGIDAVRGAKIQRQNSLSEIKPPMTTTANIVKNSSKKVIPKPTIKSTPESTLLSEAKKYKTAEEFVNKFDEIKSPNKNFEILPKSYLKTPKKLYRGESAMTGLGTGSGAEGFGLYTTTDKAVAQGYAKLSKTGVVKEMSINDIPKNPIYFRGPAEARDWATRIAKEQFGMRLPEFNEKIGINKLVNYLGNDGIAFDLGNGVAYAKYPEQGLTKSQLTDIWNKANKK